jgi:hypothetical protein
VNAPIAVSAEARTEDAVVPGGQTDDEQPAQSTDRPVTTRFFVTDGEVTIGPVDGELLARGIASGKVPFEALVWCAGWEQWCCVRDYASAHALLPTEEAAVASAKLARVSDLSPLQMPATDIQAQTLSEARDLGHAASSFLSMCAAATGAECGWVHVFSRSSGGAMVTLEGIGPRSAFGLGRTIDASDQALRAAREGRTVLGEPIPGVVGSAVAARVLATGMAASSVLMTPVLCRGQLLCMVELGIASRPAGFRARDAAICEQLAHDFSVVARKRRWGG